MVPYRLDVVSLSPDAFSSLGGLGIIKRALDTNIAELFLHNPRDFAFDRYRKVDDEPYGGGPGMLLKPEPIFSAIESIPLKERRKVIMMCPQGKPLQQQDLQRWSLEQDQLILICGQYEGFDERIRTLVDEEISIGDFILTGGELPAMVIINGLIRLLPGSLGDKNSLLEESHNNFLLDYPQYTRPENYRGMKVPDILRSGNHKAIADWRQRKREERTKNRRPDLYASWLSKKS